MSRVETLAIDRPLQASSAATVSLLTLIKVPETTPSKTNVDNFELASSK